MVRVIQNQLVADADEATPKRFTKVRLGQHLGRRASGDGSSVQQQHLVATSRIIKFVSGDHHNSTRSHLLIDDLENHGLRDKIKPGDWFIEKQHVAVLCKPLSDQDALTLPSRQFMQLPRGKISDIEPVHRRRDGIAVDLTEPSEQSERRIPRHRHSVEHGDRKTGVDIGRLQHESRWRAIDRGGPARWLNRSCQHAEQRGLA